MNHIKNYIKIKDPDWHKRLQNKSTNFTQRQTQYRPQFRFPDKAFFIVKGVLYFFDWCRQRTAVCYLMDYLIMCWRPFRNVQRRSPGAIFFILLCSFWVMRETLSALRLMSKSTILDKINKWAHLPCQFAIANSGVLPTFYVWISLKTFPAVKHFSLCPFKRVSCFLSMLWPFLTSSHTLWEEETLSH